jgi:hypothetical protein
MSVVVKFFAASTNPFHHAFVFFGHGQSLLIEQFGHLGFLAAHTRRP